MVVWFNIKGGSSVGVPGLTEGFGVPEDWLIIFTGSTATTVVSGFLYIRFIIINYQLSIINYLFAAMDVEPWLRRTLGVLAAVQVIPRCIIVH